MPRQPSYWIILSAQHVTDTYIPPEGDTWVYEVAPNDKLKKNDTVYLWSNIEQGFFGWGTIIETRKLIKAYDERERTSILVHRAKGFRHPITIELMRTDPNLRRFIPTGFDDLYALPLRPGQANALNDFIRIHNLEAPSGSTTIKWFAEEIPPQVTVQALIIAGDRVSEGVLVEGVSYAWYEIVRMISRNPNCKPPAITPTSY